MIVSKLITCGLLSLSPITKSTGQIALLEHQLSRDSPTYQTCTIQNNSNNYLQLIPNSTISQSTMDLLEYAYQEIEGEILNNSGLYVQIDNNYTQIEEISTSNIEIDEETYYGLTFYDSEELGDYGAYYNTSTLGVYPEQADEYEALYISPNTTFEYTGFYAEILNQVFSNYIQGGNSMANILSAIGTALSTIGQWFVDLFGSMTAIFYDSTTGLTFVGTLLVVGLSCFLIALVINWVRGFVRI